jgi:3',5'-cyclic AMP phosphodiesterase CpdA
MSLLIHLSDPHFGTEQLPVLEALRRLVHEQAPGVAVLSGDITQRASRSQFRAAREFTDQLGVPATLVIPGNHDIPLYNLPARIFTPYANFKREFGSELEPMFESEHLLVLTLNTTRRYRHIDGEVSAAQIERVARRLELASPAQLRIVVTHQPVHVTQPEDAVNLLHGHAAAVKRWAAAGADLILGGHIHLPFIAALHERYADLPRRLWAVQAGTAVSARIRNNVANSVNLIRYSAQAPRCCAIERWDYQPAEQRFTAAAVQTLRLDEVHHG